jgi:hypothetical protein
MRRALVVAALLAVAAAAPARACDEHARSQAAHRGPRHGIAPWVIGDSTLILSAPLLGRQGIEADAHGCRQFGEGVSLIAARPKHRLGDVAVLALGANGPIDGADIGRARRVLGPHRFLGLVTPRNLSSSAATMRAAAARHPDRVLLIDWAAYSAGHSSWFAGDNLHVNWVGAAAYARYIRERLRPFLAPPGGGLGLPSSVDAPGAVACGIEWAYGQRRAVYITRGAARATCDRARELLRAPRMDPPPLWRYYDWAPTGAGPWTDVLARIDKKVVVAGVLMPS